MSKKEGTVEQSVLYDTRSSKSAKRLALTVPDSFIVKRIYRREDNIQDSRSRRAPNIEPSKKV